MVLVTVIIRSGPHHRGSARGDPAAVVADCSPASGVAVQVILVPVWTVPQSATVYWLSLHKLSAELSDYYQWLSVKRL